MLKKYKSSEKRADLYDIGDGMMLMNVVSKNDAGKIERIYTYVGYDDGTEFLRVGIAEDLASFGSRFNYAAFMRGVSQRLGLYKSVFESNRADKILR